MPGTSAEKQAEKIYLKDVYVWTPGSDGKGEQEVWSGHVYAKKAQTPDGNTITAYSMPGEISYARKMGGFQPSSGLWYQSRARLENENSGVEENFGVYSPPS